jgi:hypothetical protein
MPTPRVNPERVLTAAERQARRRELLLAQIAALRETLAQIAEAPSVATARALAAEALRSR